MPINIPRGLPAGEMLENENIFVMNEERAITQDIRPLDIVVLNLMPTKITTETQLVRLLSNSSLQVNLTLLHPASHASKNTAQEHLEAFYHTFDEIRNRRFDGMVITGAPVENLPFEEVDYWQEMCEIMEWSKTHVFSTLHICWAAQAGLYYHYGVPKYDLAEKMFGIFPHKVLAAKHPLLRGFDEMFYAPHSRHTEIRATDIAKVSDLVLLSAGEAGVYIVADKNERRFYVTGHSEYDYDTLAKEYFRDLSRGLPIKLPKNYFPQDDPNRRPLNVWRGHAHLLFANWLNYFVYQKTPYNQNDIR